MESVLLVAALGTAVAVWLLVGPGGLPPGSGAERRGRRGIARSRARSGPTGDPARAGSAGPAASLPRGQAHAVAGLVAMVVWLLLGGWWGAGIGALAALVTPALLARLETAASRRRRLALVRAAPLLADLLGAALVAGVPLERAVPVVGRALGGPTQEALAAVHERVVLGEPASSAWARLAGEPGLGPVARCVARSARTGAPLAGLLAAAAGDLRAAATAAALAEVRAVSVRSVLPLGLCLLPAFALLGIVPVVAGLLPGA